jgi:YD repeat-containing protein
MRRLGSAGTAALLLVALLAASPIPASAAAHPAQLLPVAPQRPVPVHVVPPHPVTLPPDRPWRQPRVTWPAAGTATARLASVAPAGATAPRAARAALASPGSARAGSLPVWVGAPITRRPQAAATPAPAGVQVVMASRQAAAAAGISGVIFSVAQPSGVRGTPDVHVSLDYSSFAFASGGDYASRLRLVELPACALTTPDVPACRHQVPLSTSNSLRQFRLGTDVTLPAPPATAQGIQAALFQATPAVVLGATTATSGSDGDFTATPLSEAGTWTGGGSSGAFTYSYPIQVPPVPGRLVPQVGLGYDSQTVDGLTSSTNNQASWVGDGWNYEPGYVERDYQSCAQNPAGPTKTGDLCWSSNNVTTLSLGGTTTTLVNDPANGWHTEADNGYKITYTTGTGSNGTHDDDYWVITAPNGTSYYFGLNQLPGWASGKATTASAFTVPVYATASGQPCFNATFSMAKCQQAWRWNLDWVTDPHGDAMAYYYNSTANFYAADNGTTGTASYTQGGVPSKITYGLPSGNGYGTPTAQVTFTSATDRTDVPTDLTCSSGATCSVISPTFWAKYRLTAIDTSTLEGTTTPAQVPVDSWALHEEYLSTGATSPAPLWLQTIARTGKDGSTTIPLPAVTFGGLPKDNRTATAANLQDGYSMIPRNRLTSITTETAGVIQVTYDTEPPSCTSGSFPAEKSNTLLCYPTFWTPPTASTREDWFNKYVVSTVNQHNVVGGTVDVVTSYSYAGAAWHYDDDALTRSSQRTWDQWRGFASVTTQTGSAANSDPVTQSTSTYLQGMNGDYQGTGNPNRSASVTSQVGNVTVTDSPQFAGTEFEHAVYAGAGASPAVVSDTVATPWTSAATATQTQPSPLPALTAYFTGTAKTQAFTALAAGGYREADVTYAHDSRGRVTSAANAPDASDNGTPGDSTEDTCTQTSYDDSTSAGLFNLPAEVIVTAVTPANCPVSGTPAQSQLVSDTRDYYDGATSITTAPVKGDLTQAQQATSYSGTSEVFTTESKTTYDQYGRVTSALDANAIAAGATGTPTSTTYTPATGQEPTSVKVTDPMNLSTTTTYDQARDLPLTITSPAGLVTTETYDALGRLTAAWTPGHLTSGPADKTFTYSMGTATTPSVITTATINTAGTYLPSETLYDSLGRQVETQAQTPDGGRVITDTYYNSDGWIKITSNPYYTSGIPSATLVAAADNQVPDQTGYVYDGTGRVTRQITYSLAAEKWETDTSYGGNYTTVTPPAGGTAQTTYVNGLGKTSYIYQYHSATPPATPPAPGSGSAAGPAGWDQTAYAYSPAAQLASITDDTAGGTSTGNTWTFGYDLSGNQTSASDPDSGTTTSTYDPDGNLLSVRHGVLNTITSYAYDKDSRKTAAYDTTSGAGGRAPKRGGRSRVQLQRAGRLDLGHPRGRQAHPVRGLRRGDHRNELHAGGDRVQRVRPAAGHEHQGIRRDMVRLVP